MRTTALWGCGLVGVWLSLLACASSDQPLLGHLRADGRSGSGASGAGGAGTGANPSSGSGAASGGSEPIPPVACTFAEEVAWTLPSGFATDQLDDLADDSAASCSEGELSFGLLDMDGDERLDLVVADGCDHLGVGSDEWRVYLAGDSGFAATATSWALPPDHGGDDFDDLAQDDGGGCVEGELAYGLRDMDGDERPDLVVTDDCDAGEVGTSHWLVYLNLGDHFDAAGALWALPGGFATDQLDDLADDSGASCAAGELSFGLRDMDGDERPDLVVADKCDIGGVGSDHWLVYRNLGDGFAATAIAWGLPAAFAGEELDDLAGDGASLCSEGELSFGLRDLDGDLRPDLVLADNCDFDGVGTSQWLVYPNLGDGFASSSDSWPLPTGFATDQLDDLADDASGSCSRGELSFATLEANGDTRADLLVTDDCDVDGVGTTHWTLVASDGLGFAEARAWLLPTGGLSFDDLDDLQGDGGTACAVGELSHAAVDLDGDRVLDLVIADDCDLDEVGTTHWRVFRGACD